MNKVLSWIIPIVVGLAIYFTPAPAGITTQAWHLLGIFAFTILGFILQPLPLGAVAFIAVTAASMTGTLKMGEALSGFANSSIWLIVAAFLFSRGFIKTGLGKRIAYNLVNLLSGSTLKLSYALLLSDLVLAPATPSNTARCGGVIYPIARSLSSAFKSEPDQGPRKMGAFLMQSIYQSDTITSAMFLTSMAGNPLIATLVAQSFGYQVSWMMWFVAAIVPGAVALIVMPLVLYKLYPPEIKDTSSVKGLITEELEKMGKMTKQEWIMLGVFILALVLWATAQFSGLNETAIAFLGISILLVTTVLDWQDVIQEKGGWNTLMWMGTVMCLATFLNKLGLIHVFVQTIGAQFDGFSWIYTLIALAIIYLYAHYVFASLTVQVAAMYIAFVSIALAAGAPVYPTIFVFAFFSNLCMSLTQYAAGPAPVVFGAGYITQGKWWQLGFIASVVNIIIWLGIGFAWWKLIGLW